MAVARLVASAPFPVAAPRRAHRFLCPAASGPRALVLAPLAAARRAAAEDDGEGAALRAVAERAARKQSERRTYLVAAVMSSLGITSMAAAAVYYRFAWQMEGGEIPVTEMVGTFALSVGAAVGMEFWARWAHRALWHASLWHMHGSHHRPRDGPFELNDVFAIVNAVPAMSLLAYGFFNRGLVPGLCFGAGLGITLFGMAYMFVHDGLVHRRFPRGPHRERALLPPCRRRPSDTPHGQVPGRALRPLPRPQGAQGGGRDRGAGEGDQQEGQEERDLRCHPIRSACYCIHLKQCIPLLLPLESIF